MENLSLHHLSLFITEEVYVIPGDDIKPVAQGSLPIPQTTETASATVEETIEAIESIPALSYDGKFEKGVMVIVDEAEIKAELQELLFKILGAVGCGLKDIALVKSNALEGTSMESIQQLNPSKIILFGKVAHDIMHYRDELYKIHAEDGMEFLFADDLNAIYTTVALKKSLWNQLQILFGIQK
ncbi:hypothetical protein [Mongoliitalea lutea]|uniref:Uncharacterized protein n=1 Tax=Mongoliitalea lutea TaxID=849756 RepID=A0A8J3G421_9BACT|nr:hypothetical protein [Mongoliitalea lutea]GHB24142.1 hypothetical protein GCM10008106_01070 [Mongoliitalea lutea]